jgi:competence protein ComEA
MTDTELGALRRGAALLLLLSLARWGVEMHTGGSAEPADSVDARASADLGSFADSTRSAADDAERRARPLEEGERIDPNRADESELDRLPGVGPATARAIVAARESGAVFRASGDLEAVRGIGPRSAERMAAHLDFRRAPPGGATRRPTSSVSPVDVNRATPEELVRLPGVGPALAARIVEARRVRPFTTLADLTRVRGIGPKTVIRLRGLAAVGPPRAGS